MVSHDRERFGQLLRAEWTKLRTLPSTARSLLWACGLIVAVAVLISLGNPGIYDQAAYVDQFRFVHRPLDGDGVIVARVRSQDASHPWAMAGIMIKARAASGSPYAALMVTPGHGVRMQADFTTDLAGSATAAPRWLKLSRAGSTVTGYESADGASWTSVGAVDLAALPKRVTVGLFVTSPGITRVVPTRPAMARSGPGRATFDAVQVTADAAAQPATWASQDVGLVAGSTPAAVDAGGAVTVTGSGDIIGQADDGRRVIAAVAGTFGAVIPAMALGALLITTEYQPRTIRTTLTASPRRGRVLAAKAMVAGGVVFTGSLVATAIALAVTQPLLQRQGYRPPVYADPSLSDPTVLRVIIGTAGFLALMAMFGLGVGTIMRSSAAAISVVVAIVIVPVIVAPFLPPKASTTVQRLEPIAGMSVQQVEESDDVFLVPWVGRPWTGLGVLGAYTTAALAGGHWLLRRRDA